MKNKECTHKWRYMGFYNGAYCNTKECIKCGKLEIEKSKQIEIQKNEKSRRRTRLGAGS